jgi:hypothetical protein
MEKPHQENKLLVDEFVKEIDIENLKR